MMAIFQQVTEGVWSASWRASLLVAIVLAAQFVFGRWLTAKWRHALWFVVVVRLALPVGPGSSWSVFNLLEPKPKLATAAPVVRFKTLDFRAPQNFGAASVEAFSPSPVRAASLPPVATARSQIEMKTVLALAWLAGVVLFGMAVGMNSLRLSRRVRRMPVFQDPDVRELLAECKRMIGVRGRVDLVEAPEGTSPAVFGLWRVRMLLPASATNRFSREELRFIFLHELAHVKRRDVTLNWVMMALQTAHWFNPVVWFAFARMRTDRELACDAMALECAGAERKQAYGETIIRLLETFSRPAAAPNLLGILENKNQMRRRLRSIAKFRVSSKWSSQAAMVLIGLGCAGLTDAQEKAEAASKSGSDSNRVGTQKVSTNDQMMEVERSWNKPALRDSLPPFGNPFANTNLVYTSTPRQILFRKLETIRIDDFPLSSEVDFIEVLRKLGTEIKKRDVDGKGVNILISNEADRPIQLSGVGAVDPLTGLPAATTAAPDIDVEKFKIKFDPPIRNVTLKQFLDAIVMVAKPPEGAPSTAALKYSVEDYAIVFSLRTQETEQFFTRTYRLDPNTFRQGLEGVVFSANPFQGLVVSVGGQGGSAGQQGQNGKASGPNGFFSFGGTHAGGQGGGAGVGGGAGSQGAGITLVTTITNLSMIQSEVRAFFSAAGVDFPTNAAAGQFGGGGEQFGQVPAQRAPATKAMFFNDRAGILFVRAPLRDLDIIEQALHALNVMPPQVRIEAKFIEFNAGDEKGLGLDWFLRSGSIPNVAVGLRSPSNLPTVATMSGILTEPQFRVVMKALENRTGLDVITAPAVTTISGRQVRISVEESGKQLSPQTPPPRPRSTAPDANPTPAEEPSRI